MVISADTFQQALLSGWKELGTDMSVVTIPYVGSFPQRYKKWLFKSSTFQYCGKNSSCVGFVNLVYFKRYSIQYHATLYVKKWAKKTQGKKVIIVYSLLPFYLKAALSAKAIDRDIKIIVIALDLPEYFGETNRLIPAFISKSMINAVYAVYKNIDAYILLTKHMAVHLHLTTQPWILLEGIYNDSENKVVAKSEKKVLLYTGKLDSRFGLDVLLKAFGLMDQDYELWICGDGSMKSMIQAYAEKDRRIKFHGFLKREEVLALQRQVTLLINPRQPDSEYTKYSFPSKTMEYMASGTPTLMYHLAGIPPEYDEFLVYINGLSVEDMKDTIVDWCSKEQYELNEFGAKARQFILQNKNAKVQSKRILNFISTL
ncbi:MAG: glycosyltransferase [Bacteroidales bacterium]|nr:glycosyltransferase [Bacteroidales bacterium]